MTAVLEAVDVSVTYPTHRTFGDAIRRRERASAKAVDAVSLSVGPGEIVGVVGESGGGKTTLARCMAGMLAPTSGEIRIQGRQVSGAQRSLDERRAVQMVFQDPYSSLNPRMSVFQTIGELLRVHHLCPRSDVEAEVTRLMGQVGLDPALMHARPRNLSGGQLQRASIARALTLRPSVLVADEPVSALDVSVQAVILNLLGDLRRSLGMSILLISHDLAVVSHLCDRIAVMNGGRIVEEGATATVFDAPKDPYTRTLLAAARAEGTPSPARDDAAPLGSSGPEAVTTPKENP